MGISSFIYIKKTTCFQAWVHLGPRAIAPLLELFPTKFTVAPDNAMNANHNEHAQHLIKLILVKHQLHIFTFVLKNTTR